MKNCERTLERFVSGGRLGRWKASRHAARCPNCARALLDYRRIAAALAEPAEVDPAWRTLWASAATDDLPQVIPFSRTRFAAALRIAAVVVFGISATLIGFRMRTNRRLNPPSISSPSSDVAKSSGVSSFDDLSGKLDALDHELGELRRRAELLEVKSDAEALWNRHASIVTDRHS